MSMNNSISDVSSTNTQSFGTDFKEILDDMVVDQFKFNLEESTTPSFPLGISASSLLNPINTQTINNNNFVNEFTPINEYSNSNQPPQHSVSTSEIDNKNSTINNTNLYVPQKPFDDGSNKKKKTRNSSISVEFEKKKNKKNKIQGPIVVYMQSPEPLSMTIIDYPKFVIQHGSGLYILALKGKADPHNLSIIAIPENSDDFQLESFGANVTGDGIVKMNIKVNRINVQCDKISIIFKVLNIHEKEAELISLPSPTSIFFANTKDLPCPKLKSFSILPFLPNDPKGRQATENGLIRISLEGDRFKFGSTNELTFFVVSEDHIIHHIILQCDIKHPPNSKTEAYFLLPKIYLNQNYKLFANYIIKKNSKDKKSSKNTIDLPDLNSIWSYCSEGFVKLNCDEEI